MSLHIAFDLQEEIIIRLPVESLIRFRSVCKAWKSLIDCSEFIGAYSVLHTKPQHFLIRYAVGYRKEKKVKYVCFVDDDSFPQQKFALTVPPLVQVTTTVIGSSHGLMCLTCYFREPERTQMAVLWNPAIRKSISVAVPNVVHWPFDYVIGFGVCPGTKDPKLVKITYISDQREVESISCIPCQVIVFTLSSGEWRCSCSNQLPRKSIKFKNASQVVIGQFIYWCAYDWSDVDGEPRNLIMSFDMSTEEFREIEIPDNLAYVPELDISVSRLKESLVLLDYNYRETTKKYVCDVWMMEHRDSRVFTKLFTINAPVSKTLGFRNSGEPIVETLRALVVYEPCSEHLRDLGIRGNKFSFFVSSYTESLLLLNHDDGQIIRC